MSAKNAGLLVGVIHLPPLPGSPRAALGAGAKDAARSAAEDARALEAAGYDLVMIENFGDEPFFAGRVPAVTVSAMTACALAVRDVCPTLALGINVLRNDADAALAIAAVCDAKCIRINVHTGARVTDQGLIGGDAATTLRTRRALGVDRIQIWADVDVKHSAALAPRAIADETHDLASRGMVDAVLVTGEGTGRAVDLAKLDTVRAATRLANDRLPVIVASGASIAMLPELAGRCDGVVVGSALREGGRAGGRVLRSAAEDFARAFRKAFAERGA